MNFIREHISSRFLLVALALQILSCSIRVPVATCYAVQAGISSDHGVSLIKIWFDILSFNADEDTNSHESGNEECVCSDEIEQNILLFYEKTIDLALFCPTDLVVQPTFSHIVVHYSECFSKITPPPPKV